MSWLRAIYNFFYEIFFGCSHGHLTRPFTIQTNSYKVCLDCGRQFPYSLEKMRTLHAWEAARMHPQLAEVASMAVPASFVESGEYERGKAVA